MNESIRQEIKWLQEEIADDESIRDTREFSGFHEQRIAENTEKLNDLLDAHPEFKNTDSGC